MIKLLLKLLILYALWIVLIKPALFGAAGLLADLMAFYWWMYPTPPV